MCLCDSEGCNEKGCDTAMCDCPFADPDHCIKVDPDGKLIYILILYIFLCFQGHLFSRCLILSHFLLNIWRIGNFVKSNGRIFDFQGQFFKKWQNWLARLIDFHMIANIGYPINSLSGTTTLRTEFQTWKFRNLKTSKSQIFWAIVIILT